MMILNGKMGGENIMKKLYLYTIILAVILAMAGCTQIENVDQIPEPTVRMTITASTEGGDETKALMGDENEDGSRSILWEQGDSIRILSDRGGNMVDTFLFVNNTTENSKIATFEGEINEEVYDILASYPYTNWINYQYSEHWNGENWVYESFYTIHLPRTQRYRENNFDRKAFPMVCYKNSNITKVADPLEEFGTFEFKNLCGVLALNLVGEISVRSITMTATTDSSGISTPANLSGSGIIKQDINSYYILDMNSSAWNQGPSTSKTVILECPDVQLDPDTPTPFHIVLPPGKYSSFSLTITTSDGRIMLVNVDKELVINRSKARHTTPLTYTETIPVNLSDRGTSNSYIVSEGGAYKFDASVIGNGKAGIIEGVYFHTTDPSITPNSAELLWESPSGLITGLGYNSEEKTISFIASALEGNALIAAKDENGDIIWSWHIWCTDKPKEQTYINYSDQTFSVQDRNLGATRADRGTGNEWIESVGLHYQWGRKDPFTYNPNSDERTLSWQLSIEESISNPTRVSSNDCWIPEFNQSLWTDTLKTIYDPCPVGYKVPPQEVWSGFTTTGNGASKKDEINASGDWDCGWYFIYDGTNTAWYPATSRADRWNGVYSQFPSIDRGYYWSSSSDSWNSKGMHIFYESEYNLTLSYNLWGCGQPYSVRCIVDMGYVDTALPIVSVDKISSIGYESAHIEATATTPEGVAEILSKGLVWSTEHNPTLENGAYSAEVTSEEFAYDITGLDDFTTYYVRAYATNANGTQYSEERSFTTNYNGPVINLSESGTANCYIVPPTADHYSIDLSVIGNGTAGLIDTANFHTTDVTLEPENVKIVWAIKYDNYSGTSPTSELLSFREFNKEKKIFHFVPTGTEGNVLLAATDADNNIIWSWHLWITDQPGEHNYINHEGKIYTVMDRNIGATRADRGSGEQWKESAGFVYQWGRKDPFHDAIEDRSGTAFFITESILYPNMISASYDWVYDDDPVDRKLLWTSKTKTIYDPCPVGYRVPPKDTWTGFTTTGENVQKKIQINMSGNWDKGYNFKYDGTNTAWYPSTMYAYWTPYWQDNSGGLWSGDAYGNWENVCYFDYYYNSDMELNVSPSTENNSSIGYGRAVRCVIDSDHHDVAFPYVTTISVDNVTSNSALAKGEVVSEGLESVTARGFVWATQENPTLANSWHPVTTEGSYLGGFEATIVGLEPGTTYYIRAYATNPQGTSYGKSIQIRTKDGGSGEGYDRDEDFEW